MKTISIFIDEAIKDGIEFCKKGIPLQNNPYKSFNEDPEVIWTAADCFEEAYKFFEARKNEQN
jgi:hypothetical protein